MTKQPITEGYVQGFEDCLSSISKIADIAIRRNDDGTAKGLAMAWNELIEYLHYKRFELKTLQGMLEEQQALAEDAFEEQACTYEVHQIDGKDLIKILNKILGGR